MPLMMAKGWGGRSEDEHGAYERESMFRQVYL